jgi:hypothetical protein
MCIQFAVPNRPQRVRVHAGPVRHRYTALSGVGQR